MGKEIIILDKQSPKTERIERLNDNPIALGQWRWVETVNYKDEVSWVFACVTYLGSNYAKFETPHCNRHGCSSWRVHFNDLDIETRIEMNPQEHIQKQIDINRGLVHSKLKEVKQLTSNLGVGVQVHIDQPTTEHSTALTVMSGSNNIDNYKTDLVKAKEVTLPTLFKEIEKANEQLAKWMSAELLPMKAQTGDLNSATKAVESRIFKVSLYAGLTEQVELIKEGEAAPIDTKLHIMQRQLYMDEECLLGYRHGGMVFKNINEFDEWLCEKDNLKRILPFDRCVVALKVRRIAKEREEDGTLHTSLINFNLGKLDELTFMYFRNGENVYRMSCDQEFGEMIFPSQSEFKPGVPMMLKYDGHYGSVRENLITVHDYDERCKAEVFRKRYKADWNRLNLTEDHWKNPYRRGDFDKDKWEAFDPKSVYYDDVLNSIAEKMDKYNRIVLIIQGLYDRSPVFHPHPPIRTWEADDFNANIKLIYDGEHILAPTLEPPSFKEYRDKCNLSMGEGSVVIGQEDYWLRKEAKKENNRMNNDWRDRGNYRHEHFAPYGNPGPKHIAIIEKWKPRVKKATFSWMRERQKWNREPWESRGIKTAIVVPISALFNVSAYKPGDFKQFFEDPRTREQYLKWAPMLLAAEEFYAGFK